MLWGKIKGLQICPFLVKITNSNNASMKKRVMIGIKWTISKKKKKKQNFDLAHDTLSSKVYQQYKKRNLNKGDDAK